MTASTLPYSTIGDVLAQMDQVIAQCIQRRSKLGYFAVLYRNVTLRVQQGIAAGRFENGARLERLDVLFAQRYLQAIEQLWRGEAPTRSWAVAFEAARFWPPIILQHLVLGMNAHINLDLAIAAAQVSPGSELPDLKRDFDEISQLLIEMILEVQTRVERVSPWFRLLDRVGGRTDEQLCAFALQVARRRAWQVAEQLALAPPEARERAIAVHDQLVAGLGRGLFFPSFRLGSTHMLIRLREVDDVPRVIEALRG
ncbi:MAG: DUF5995 family protein [Anaerolineales bacterium]